MDTRKKKNSIAFTWIHPDTDKHGKYELNTIYVSGGFNKWVDS